MINISYLESLISLNSNNNSISIPEDICDTLFSEILNSITSGSTELKSDQPLFTENGHLNKKFHELLDSINTDNLKISISDLIKREYFETNFKVDEFVKLYDHPDQFLKYVSEKLEEAKFFNGQLKLNTKILNNILQKYEETSISKPLFCLTNKVSNDILYDNIELDDSNKNIKEIEDKEIKFKDKSLVSENAEGNGFINFLLCHIKKFLQVNDWENKNDKEKISNEVVNSYEDKYIQFKSLNLLDEKSEELNEVKNKNNFPNDKKAHSTLNKISDDSHKRKELLLAEEDKTINIKEPKKSIQEVLFSQFTLNINTSNRTVNLNSNELLNKIGSREESDFREDRYGLKKDMMTDFNNQEINNVSHNKESLHADHKLILKNNERAEKVDYVSLESIKAWNENFNNYTEKDALSKNFDLVDEKSKKTDNFKNLNKIPDEIKKVSSLFDILSNDHNEKPESLLIEKNVLTTDILQPKNLVRDYDYNLEKKDNISDEELLYLKPSFSRSEFDNEKSQFEKKLTYLNENSNVNIKIINNNLKNKYADFQFDLFSKIEKKEDVIFLEGGNELKDKLSSDLNKLNHAYDENIKLANLKQFNERTKAFNDNVNVIKNIPKIIEVDNHKFVINKKSENLIELTVEPDGIGRLEIEITSESGKISAKIYPSDNLAKGFIEQNLKGIMESLSKEGISLGSFSIAMGDRRQSSYDREELPKGDEKKLKIDDEIKIKKNYRKDIKRSNISLIV